MRIKYSIKKEVTESELKEALDNGFRLDIEKHDNCPFEIQIHDLSKQSDKIDKFISDAEPLLEYVRAEIQRNDEKSKLYKKLYEQVLGWGVIGIVSLLGSWIFALMTIVYPVVCGKIRQYLGGL